MRFTLFLCIALVMASACQAQFFKSLAKPQQTTYGLSRPLSLSLNSTTPLPDSTYLGFRPIASAAYGYSSAGGSSLMAGVGISYEHDTYSSTSLKWYTDWSVSLQGYAGGSVAPTSLASVTAVGLTVSFFNKLLTVGAGYNFANKNYLPLVGPGISLNN